MGRPRGLLSAVVLVALVTPALVAIGVGAQVATPAVPGSANEPLFTVVLAPEQLPVAEARVLVSRETWTPGGTGSTSLSGWSSVNFDGGTAGAVLDYVETGSLRMRLDQTPLLVWRSAAGVGAPPESIAAGEEVDLGPGDIALHPLQFPWTATNEGSTDAVVLSVVIVSALVALANPVETYTDVSVESLGGAGVADWAAIPSGPIAVSLDRTTLEPGVALPPAPVVPASPQLLTVESGVMEIDDLLADGTRVGALTVQPGGVIPLPYPDQATRVVRAGAGEPLVYRSLTFSPTTAAAPEPVTARGVIPETVPVGEVAHTGALDLTVTAVDRSTEPIATIAPVDEFVLVTATLTPVTMPVIWNLDWFELSDAAGKVYPIAFLPTDALALAESDRLTRAFAQLEVGTSYEIVLVFDVPAGATGLVLQASDFAASFVADGAPEPFAVALD